MTTALAKASALEAGCWIDGHWGRFATARLVEIARGFGWELDGVEREIAERVMAELIPSGPLAEDEDWEALIEQGGLGDRAEAWMNEHVAPRHYSFGWYEGEFFLWPHHAWCEGDGPCDCTSAEIALGVRFA